MSKYPKILKKAYRQVLPRLLQDKIDVFRGESQVFRPCFQETKSIFIHIPKAAGTSIARAIYGMNVGHRKADDYIQVSKSEFYKYYRFSFVRNPWDRTISAYNFIKQGGTSLVKPLPNKIYQSNVFDSFEIFVTEWLPYANLTIEDVVFEHQYKYIYDPNDKLLIDYLGKVETMKMDIIEIENAIGKSISVKSLNRSNRRSRDYREAYNDKTAEIVNGIYSQDIKRFKYSF